MEKNKQIIFLASERYVFSGLIEMLERNFNFGFGKEYFTNQNDLLQHLPQLLSDKDLLIVMDSFLPFARTEDPEHASAIKFAKDAEDISHRYDSKLFLIIFAPHLIEEEHKLFYKQINCLEEGANKNLKETIRAFLG